MRSVDFTMDCGQEPQGLPQPVAVVPDQIKWSSSLVIADNFNWLKVSIQMTKTVPELISLLQ